MRTSEGKTRRFLDLHQLSSLSLYLFALVMDKFTKLIQKEVHWYFVFVDDIGFSG